MVPKPTPKLPIPTDGNAESTSKQESSIRAGKKGPASHLKRVTHSASQPSQPERIDIMTSFLAIMAEEVGLDKSEISPSNTFADLGIDSLLSLNIASRLREELGLDVEGSLFSDCPTPVELVKSISNSEAPTPPTSDSTPPSTPELDPASEASDDDDTDQTSLDGDKTSTMSIIRHTIAEEVGILETELTDSLDLNELGMDSLLSLTILGKLRDELEIDLPADLFAKNSSLNGIEVALGLKPKAVCAASEVDPTPAAQSADPISNGIPHASSVLLQGNPRSASKTLFLFPDGSGSATSYAPLPRISPNIAVYGLNCPYMKTPQNMKCSLEAITPRYLQEIRRRQPVGPYYFGGWSAGGICAFDAAQELDRRGEKVERLILIDSPFPIGLEKLPPRLYDFFKSVGLFGEGDRPPPSWLLPHFLAFVDSLDLYKAKPFELGRGPPTRLVWARDGVCKYPESPRPEMRDDDPKEMKWLLNNRTDFGSNGWERLLGTDDLVIETMDDANHFTMMAGDKVKELAVWVRKAMD